VQSGLVRYAEWAVEPATAHSARSRGARQPRCLRGAQVHGGAAARTVGLLNARAERARQPLQILCLRDREAEAQKPSLLTQRHAIDVVVGSGAAHEQLLLGSRDRHHGLIAEPARRQEASSLPNYAGGRDVVAGVKQTFKGEFVGKEYTRWAGQLDFSPELSKLRTLWQLQGGGVRADLSKISPDCSTA
jgi:hypothetical protein